MSRSTMMQSWSSARLCGAQHTQRTPNCERTCGDAAGDLDGSEERVPTRRRLHLTASVVKRGISHLQRCIHIRPLQEV